ncbi:MAG: hypothetical protein Q8T11_02700 [Elusimicrobiota bacterium]|nr:hypothetical protein [Elusimicrobiota bacterium]
MMGLWADGWFYISSAGLLISGILFFFLLGQYRLASEAADATEEQAADKEAAVPDVAVRPVYIPDEEPSAKVVSHADAPEPEPKPKVEETPFVERRRDPATSTGGISPAVVYLQNIKVELADLHKDLRALSKRVDDELSSVSTRDEALIERLGELTRAVEGLKAAAAPAADEEAPKPARKSRKAEKAPEPEPEPAPEPAPEVVVAAPKPAEEVAIEVLPPPPVDEPLPEPAAPAKTFSPDETIRMELGEIIAPPAAAEEPVAAEPAQPAEAPAAEEKPRRGPVWPV